MLDYRFIKENLDAVKANIAARNMKADADTVVDLFDRRTALVTSLQLLQTKRNDNAKAMKGKLSDDERKRLIDEGKSIKEDIARSEAELAQAEADLETAGRQIPNMAHPEAPVGKEDKDNTEVARFGEPTKFPFEPKDHVQLGEALDLLDFEAGTKVSGTKFYYVITSYSIHYTKLYELTSAMAVARVAYGIAPEGSVLTLYGFAGIFMLAMSGFGLVISNYAKTLQQAMFMIFFFVITWIYLSGLYTPAAGMPPWAQAISRFSPLRYMIAVLRAVYLKGSGFADLAGEAAALAGFALGFNGWAMLSYRKTE